MNPALDKAMLDKRFTHYPPTEATLPVHESVRAAYKQFASEIVGLLPDGREKALVFTALEESSFWAHAAIAREGK